MSKKTVIIDVILNIAVAVFGMTAFICGVIKNGISTISFYTEDSNLFASVACGVYAVAMLKHKMRDKISHFVYFLKYASVVCLTITFLVVFVVLAPMGGGIEGYKTMFFCDSMIFTHFLCPLFSVYSFVKFEHIKKPLKFVFYSTLPTIIYGIVMLTLNALKVIEGPYPFFFVYLNPTLAAVCCPLISVCCFIVSFVFNSIKSPFIYSSRNV